MNQNLNEAETRAELIDPVLAAAGWGKVDDSRVRREVITLGRLTGGGKRSKQDIADYVLVYRGLKLAVIEAKKVSLPDTEGLGQAKRYATKLQIRFAYSTNGKGIYRVDMETGDEGYVSGYPNPDELWSETFAEQNNWRDNFSAVPFEDKGGAWEARYYQHNFHNIHRLLRDFRLPYIRCANRRKVTRCFSRAICEPQRTLPIREFPSTLSTRKRPSCSQRPTKKPINRTSPSQERGCSWPRSTRSCAASRRPTVSTRRSSKYLPGTRRPGAKRGS